MYLISEVPAFQTGSSQSTFLFQNDINLITFHKKEVTPNKKASPFLRLTGQRPAQ